MADHNEQLQQLIERAVMDCVDQKTMPRDLLEEKLDRIIETVDGTNGHLEKLNGNVADNTRTTIQYGQWKEGHFDSHQELERRIKNVEGENRIINVLQALWAPLAAALIAMFKGQP